MGTHFDSQISSSAMRVICGQSFKKTINLAYQRLNNFKQFSSNPDASVKPFDSIPGPSSLPLIGSIHHFLPLIGSIGPPQNFYDMSKKLYLKFGSIVKLNLLSQRVPIVILYEPDQFDQVYRAEEGNPLRPGFDTLIYYRTQLRKSTFDGVYGLTTAQGPQWREFRTKVNPALLKPKLVKLYEPEIDKIAQEVVNRFQKLKNQKNYLNQNIDKELMKWSLESVAVVALGTRIGCLKDELNVNDPAFKLIKSAQDIMRLSFKLEFLPSIWRYVSTPNFRKIIEAFDTQWNVSKMFIEQAKQVISERKEDVPEEDKSVIEKLLAIDKNVAIMMANEMLMAGIETVAFATLGQLYLLATNSNIQKKVRDEFRSGDPKKRYLRACLKESLRLMPVISANLRRTTKEHFVGGYHIPKNVEVIAPNEFLSRMDKFYPRPSEFLPERWLVDKSDPLYYGNAPPMTTLPFGFGVRSCIGRRVAELEIENIISNLVANFEITWHGPPVQIQTKVVNMFVKPYYFNFEQVI